MPGLQGAAESEAAEVKLKTFRVHFEIEGSSYRDVQAFDEEDAREQVDRDSIYSDDIERANLSQICVDDIVELKPARAKRKGRGK